jgi:hypothetical protein
MDTSKYINFYVIKLIMDAYILTDVTRQSKTPEYTSFTY